jgi:uncharacterized protein YuzE
MRKYTFNRKVTECYDKESDIMYINWGKVDNSREIFDGNVLIDFDVCSNIVGIEIFNLGEEIKKSQIRINKLFKLKDKGKKKNG